MRIKNFLKERTYKVGLDIQEDIIHAFFSGKSVSIATPPDSIRNGFIVAPDKIAQALRQLWNKNKINSKNVSLAIHGQDLLLHNITIPYAKDEAVLSILENRVNQYVVFTGVRTIIGWEKLGETSETGERRLKVLLALAKRELVESYISAAEKAGLLVNAIAFPSLILIKALLDGRLKKDLKERRMFVELNGKQSFVHILEGGVNIFAHTINLGAKDILSSSDKILNRVQEIQKKILRESEIKNITIHYSDPKIKTFITELAKTFNREVQIEFNLVAASLARGDAIKINLLPDEVKTAQEWRTQSAYFLMVISGLSLFMLTLFFMFYLGSFVLDRKIIAVNAELNKPNEQFVRLKEIENKTNEINELLAGRKRIAEKSHDFPWDDLFNELDRIVPSHVYLTRFEIAQEETIIISGVAASSDNIFNFVRKLKEAKHFKNVDLKMIKEVEFTIYAEKK